ncbi:MAG: hypothetical protein AABY97_03420 [Chloroflexota bacterium]
MSAFGSTTGSRAILSALQAAARDPWAISGKFAFDRRTLTAQA